MLQGIIATVTETSRSAITTTQKAGDEASAGLLTDRLSELEKQRWMMASMVT